MESAEYAVMHEQEMVHWWFRGRRVLLERLSGGISRPGARGHPRLRLRHGGQHLTYAALGPVVGVEPTGARSGSLPRAPTAGRHRIDYCRAVGTALPFRKGSFDAVVASDVLEHIADHEGATREIAGCSNRRRVRVSVPAHPGSGAGTTRRSGTSGGTAGPSCSLASAGLAVRWLSYWNAALFPAIALRRVLAPGAGGKVAVSDAALPPAPVNRVLTGVLGAEARMLDWVRFPFGVSLVGVAIPAAH